MFVLMIKMDDQSAIYAFSVNNLDSLQRSNQCCTLVFE